MIAAKLYKLALTMRNLNLIYIRDPKIWKPAVKMGKRERNGKSIPVIRVYSSDPNHKQIEYRLSSSKAKKWENHFIEQEKRFEIEKHLEFRHELEHWENPCASQSSSVSDSAKQPYSREVFDKLVERNDPDIKKEHVFDGHRFRSKSEMMIAQLLKSLGLEYKYDVIVSFGGEVFYIDFAIYCHETGRFFFMEHFGDMASENYRYRTFHKIKVYTSNGLVEGWDILYTYENNEDSFNINVYEGKILSIVATHAMSSYTKCSL